MACWGGDVRSGGEKKGEGGYGESPIPPPQIEGPPLLLPALCHLWGQRSGGPPCAPLPIPVYPGTPPPPRSVMWGGMWGELGGWVLMPLIPRGGAREAAEGERGKGSSCGVSGGQRGGQRGGVRGGRGLRVGGRGGGVEEWGGWG